MDITLDITDDVALIRFDDGKKNAFTGIGHTSWLLAQRPSMGVMLNTQGCPWRAVLGLTIFICDPRG